MRVRYGKYWFGFEWDKNKKYNTYRRNFYPFNWIDEPELRYLGYFEDWYDGPLPSFGFWFFNMSWSWWRLK